MIKRLLLLTVLTSSAFASRGFNGTNQAINSGSNKDDAGGLSTFTMAVWAYPTSAVANNRIFTMSNDQFPGFYSVVLFIDPSLHVAAYMCASGCTTIASSITPSANAWFHMAVTLTGGTATLYYNGASVATGAVTGTLVGVQPTTAGGGYNGGGYNLLFTGNVAEAGIWSVALSAGEVKALAKGTPPSLVRVSTSVPGSAPNGWLYWPFHGFASPEPDLSGSPNGISSIPANGSLINAPTHANHCPCGMPTGEGH